MLVLKNIKIFSFLMDSSAPPRNHVSFANEWHFPGSPRGAQADPGLSSGLASCKVSEPSLPALCEGVLVPTSGRPGMSAEVRHETRLAQRLPRSVLWKGLQS